MHITENCGILDKLLPGDLILADIRFTVQESVDLYCAKVTIPPFTCKKQLSKCEVDTSPTFLCSDSCCKGNWSSYAQLHNATINTSHHYDDV